MSNGFEIESGTELSIALRRASAYLAERGISQPYVEAELLAAYFLSRERAEEIGRGRVQTLAMLGATVPTGFAEAVEMRGERVPLQHITGQAFFRYLTLKVGPGVFSPRPETELLVDRVLQEIDTRPEQSLKIVDLCTGSGAIAASIASERPGHEVFAVELSELAHAWAQENVASLDVHLILGDATSALARYVGTFDIVATNPPYIPNGAVPQDPEVRDHDPAMALYGGSEDGLQIPAQIATHAFELLRPGGLLVMEHAETQRDSMRAVFTRCGFVELESINDLNMRPRHTVGRKPAGR